jgi:DNA-binding response OmpR family regulator
VREAGAVACLAKPIDVRTFLDTITSLLEQSTKQESTKQESTKQESTKQESTK